MKSSASRSAASTSLTCSVCESLIAMPLQSLSQRNEPNFRKTTRWQMKEGFITMSHRWMKRRIERSRARCATDRHRPTRTELPETRCEQLPDSLSRVVEKQSLKFRLHAKVE